MLYAGQVVEQGADRRRAGAAAAPLHQGPAGRDPAPERSRGRLAAIPGRLPDLRSPRRLPVPAALPVRRRRRARSRRRFEPRRPRAVRCHRAAELARRGVAAMPGGPRAERAAPGQASTDAVVVATADSPRPSRCRVASPLSPSRAGGRATGRCAVRAVDDVALTIAPGEVVGPGRRVRVRARSTLGPPDPAPAWNPTAAASASPART